MILKSVLKITRMRNDKSVRLVPLTRWRRKLVYPYKQKKVSIANHRHLALIKKP